MNIPTIRLNRGKVMYLRNIAFLSIILNFIIEILNMDSLIEALSSIAHKPHIFLYNSFIIMVTLTVSLFFKRRVVVCSVISIVWLGFGITNNVLLHFRVTPFTAVDLRLIDEAIPILNKYCTPIQMVGVVILAIAIVIGLIFAFIKIPKHKDKINYVTNTITFAIIVFLATGITSLGMNTNVLAKNFGNIADAYKDYGFVYCFTNSLINTGISKPRNYSQETIQTIVDTAEEAPTPAVEDISSNKTEEMGMKPKKPNVIFLQLESFFDPTLIKGMTFSSDPLPNYHRLQANYTNGYLSVPSVGAGTANTEFEIITGMNLDFFGPGEYPYKTILKRSTCESMAFNMKELGYSTHAIHNNTGTFYGRHRVFANLGFDTFTSEEYMKNITYNPLGWANDDVLVEEIMNVLNSTEGTDYIYTISVQGHGKYPESPESLYNGTASDPTDDDFSQDTSSDEAEKSLEKDTANKQKHNLTPSQTEALNAASAKENKITIDGIEESRKYAFEYYVNQIHEMDAFVGKLVDTLESFDEDVVLVMYGDHLPSLGIKAEDLENNDIYTTEYIIWSSKGVIDGQFDRNIQAYQLSAYTLSLLGQNPGIITKLHQQQFGGLDKTKDSSSVNAPMEEFPETPTPSASTASEESDDTSSESISYLDELKLLQYDMLYGKKECFGGTEPYQKTTIQMGLYPVTISSVEYADLAGTVHGQNFTKKSIVRINGEPVETTFVDENTLTFTVEEELPEDSKLRVCQCNSNCTALSKTVEWEIR